MKRKRVREIEKEEINENEIKKLWEHQKITENEKCWEEEWNKKESRNILGEA